MSSGSEDSARMGSDSDSDESVYSMLCSGYDDPGCDPYRSDIILWIIQFY